MTDRIDTGEPEQPEQRTTRPAAVRPAAGSFVGATVATVDADGRELPIDVAAWIDEHDPVPRPLDDADIDVLATTEATRALADQRAEHEPSSRISTDPIGVLVNNTGDDGGAASG